MGLLRLFVWLFNLNKVLWRLQLLVIQGLKGMLNS